MSDSGTGRNSMQEDEQMEKRKQKIDMIPLSRFYISPSYWGAYYNSILSGNTLHRS